MNELLQRLYTSDTQISNYINDLEVINQGLAPLLTTEHSSITLKKATLLEQSKHQNWNQQANILFHQFHQKKINFLVFKGFAFTHLLYDNTWIRPYADIDILISKPDYEETEKTLTQLGFQKIKSRQGQFVSFQNSFIKSDLLKTTIDLHWQVNNRIEFHQHFPFKELYKNSIPIEFEGQIFNTPNNIDSFIIGCFHYLAHRPEDRNHIWLYDLSLIWLKLREKDQISCLKTAHQKQQIHIVTSVLEILSVTFMGVFNLEELNIEVQKEATQEYINPRPSKFNDIKIRLKSIKGFKNKFKFISEYIFQSREYVQNRFGLKSKAFIYLYYPKMWLQDLLKLFK